MIAKRVVILFNLLPQQHEQTEAALTRSVIHDAVMTTSLRSRCPHCQAILKIKESQVGNQVRCPACNEKFTVDSVEATSGSTSLEHAQPASETVAVASSDTGDLAGGKCRPRSLLGAGLPTAPILGRFQLNELLGQGAFGRVYKAYDRGMPTASPCTTLFVTMRARALFIS